MKLLPLLLAALLALALPASSQILRYLPGIRMAESSGNPRAVGDDGRSLGAYQINEDFHAERAALYGEYDAFDEGQARRVAGLILEANLAAMTRISRACDPDTWLERREELAIASYRQGLRGVRESGAAYWYVERVQAWTE